MQQAPGAQAQGSVREKRAEQPGCAGEMHHGVEAGTVIIGDGGLCQMVDGTAVGPPFPLQGPWGHTQG